MRHSNNSRLVNAFVAAISVLPVGIYCLFIHMGTYNFVPLVIGLMMLTATLMLRDESKQRSGGVLMLFAVILLFTTFNNMINSMVSQYSIDLGSEDLNFGIIDRAITVIGFSIGGSFGLVAAMDAMLQKNEFLKMLNKWHVPKITMLLDAVLTTFMFVWISFYLMIVRHPFESLVFWPMAAGSLVAFFYGWWAINRRKSLGIVMFGNLLCAILFGFLALLDFIYLPLCVLNILSNMSLKTMTGEKITFWPRFKQRNRIFEISAIPALLLAVLVVPLPFIITQWPESTITVEKGLDQEVMEINWAIGSEQKKDFDWYIQPEVINTINSINGNVSTWGLNISVTIPLVREIFNSSISDIMKELFYNNITFDIMPIIDSSQFGFSDEYIHDGTIDKFEDIYNEMREWLINDGVINNSNASLPNGKMYRALVVDLERSQQIAGSIIGQVMNYMGGPDQHVLGSNKLIELMNKFKENGENVAGAFFDFHIFDFVDLDDAQQEFFKISIIPPYDWEFIAAMVYQNGPGSNLSVLAYANDMNYHFGDKSVPYVVTMNSDYEDILARFQILKNTGFNKVGCWAMHELFFNGNKDGDDSNDLFGVDRPHYDADGNPDTWTFNRFLQLHEDLGVDQDVTFTVDGLSPENQYYMLSMLLDIWLVRRAVYWSWPIMGERLPNPQFLNNTILCIIGYAVIAFFTIYIAWNPLKGRKKKSEGMDPVTKKLLSDDPLKKSK